MLVKYSSFLPDNRLPERKPLVRNIPPAESTFLAGIACFVNGIQGLEEPGHIVSQTPSGKRLGAGTAMLESSSI